MNYADQIHCKVCHCIIPLYQLEEHDAGFRHMRKKKKMMDKTNMKDVTVIYGGEHGDTGE